MISVPSEIMAGLPAQPAPIKHRQPLRFTRTAPNCPQHHLPSSRPAIATKKAGRFSPALLRDLGNLTLNLGVGPLTRENTTKTAWLI